MSAKLIEEAVRVLELERNPDSRSALPPTNGSNESVELEEREEESSMEEGRRELGLSDLFAFLLCIAYSTFFFYFFISWRG
jgi:hypothetical protein